MVEKGQFTNGHRQPSNTWNQQSKWNGNINYLSVSNVNLMTGIVEIDEMQSTVIT